MNKALALTSRKGEESKTAIIQGGKEHVPEEMEKEGAGWSARQLSAVRGGQELAKVSGRDDTSPRYWERGISGRGKYEPRYPGWG